MAPRLKILAIDPGMRNLAFCYMEEGRVLDVGRSDIFRGEKIAVANVFTAITAWCESRKELFDAADVVVVERQFCDSKVTLSACLIAFGSLSLSWNFVLASHFPFYTLTTHFFNFSTSTSSMQADNTIHTQIQLW